ncbi:hypothetical protein F4821DRAFT_239671 [Hypoxylon rubiginosum]|uniref:Uncharacterized protein n=1 Tax=Hypoxylon rubiginosum TaxID=110542 RepID=A0ACC0CZC4_9PEZI|nr:hypothetical protein F4821DRAFT_239671 [Hypoxylon rubiginosum]
MRFRKGPAFSWRMIGEVCYLHLISLGLLVISFLLDIPMSFDSSWYSCQARAASSLIFYWSSTLRFSFAFVSSQRPKWAAFCCGLSRPWVVWAKGCTGGRGRI